jgi:hypothetical protein
MFQVSLFLALVGGISGALIGTMEYNVAHGGEDWFHGAGGVVDPRIKDTSFYSSENSSGLNPSESDITDTGTVTKVVTGTTLLWKAMSGVFYIEPQIERAIVVTDPDTGDNLFAPYAWIVQIGIWLIYAIGMWEMYTGKPIKMGY